MKLVGTSGFEPPTPASRTLCSTRLSHVPTKDPSVCHFIRIVNLKSMLLIRYIQLSGNPDNPQ